jgi:hypothetical protein
MFRHPLSSPPTERQLAVERQAIEDRYRERLRCARRQFDFGHDEAGRRLLAEAYAEIHEEVRGALCRLTGDVSWLTTH